MNKLYTFHHILQVWGLTPEEHSHTIRNTKAVQGDAKLNGARYAGRFDKLVKA